MDTSTLPPNSQPQITVIEGTKIQDLAPPPDLTSDIVLQNEINHYQKQKAKQKTVSLKVEDEGKLNVAFIRNSYFIWDKIFKNGSKIFKGCLPQMFSWSILEYLDSYDISFVVNYFPRSFKGSCLRYFNFAFLQ